MEYFGYKNFYIIFAKKEGNMGVFNFKSKQEVILHLREVKRRKKEWQEKAKADYKELMKETESERQKINAVVIN